MTSASAPRHFVNGPFQLAPWFGEGNIGKAVPTLGDNVSTSGVSFYLPTKPLARFFVVDLGTETTELLVLVQVVHYQITPAST